ncbi:Pkinase-domain-containing protein [Meredithblackwellia eburnea MCA 4105]
MASALFDQIKDTIYALTGSCCSADATLKLNGRSYKILKLLGEGGFSYVYLAQDTTSLRLFALKKIRCPLGSDSVREALKEVEAYKRFRHPNIIRCLDSSVVQDDQGEGGKVIYLFLPYYKNGTVQHVISSNVVNGTSYPEKSMLSLFLGTCLAVRSMHFHHLPSTASSTSSYPPSSSVPTITIDDGSGEVRRGGIRAMGESTEEEDDEDDDEGKIMGSSGSGSGVGGGRGDREALISGDGGRALEDHALEMSGDGAGLGEIIPGKGKGKGEEKLRWAHRDIKPANVMIADDGVTPILMDFGSALPARIPIPNRTIALTQQDLAAEQCSMAFRAPELFDVKTNTTLTESVDIWSLGCTLFCMAYGYSPFETPQQSEHGGSVAMAALSGKYRFPDEGKASVYSEGFKDIVRGCLKVKVEERWDIDQVIDATQTALAKLN